MHFNQAHTANGKNQTGSNAHWANPLLEVDWNRIESALEWNVSICVVACLQYRPISATTQMLIVNIRGLGKDTPTSRFYHVIIRGLVHISLSQSTLHKRSADAIKTALKPVPAIHIQSRSDLITVRTGLWNNSWQILTGREGGQWSQLLTDQNQENRWLSVLMMWSGLESWLLVLILLNKLTMLVLILLNKLTIWIPLGFPPRVQLPNTSG